MIRVHAGTSRNNHRATILSGGCVARVASRRTVVVRFAARTGATVLPTSSNFKIGTLNPNGAIASLLTITSVVVGSDRKTVTLTTSTDMTSDVVLGWSGIDVRPQSESQDVFGFNQVDDDIGVGNTTNGLRLPWSGSVDADADQYYYKRPTAAQRTGGYAVVVNGRTIAGVSGATIKDVADFDFLVEHPNFLINNNGDEARANDKVYFFAAASFDLVIDCYWDNDNGGVLELEQRVPSTPHVHNSIEITHNAVFIDGAQQNGQNVKGTTYNFVMNANNEDFLDYSGSAPQNRARAFPYRFFNIDPNAELHMYGTTICCFSKTRNWINVQFGPNRNPLSEVWLKIVNLEGGIVPRSVRFWWGHWVIADLHVELVNTPLNSDHPDLRNGIPDFHSISLNGTQADSFASSSHISGVLVGYEPNGSFWSVSGTQVLLVDSKTRLPNTVPAQIGPFGGRPGGTVRLATTVNLFVADPNYLVRLTPAATTPAAGSNRPSIQVRTATSQAQATGLARAQFINYISWAASDPIPSATPRLAAAGGQVHRPFGNITNGLRTTIDIRYPTINFKKYVEYIGGDGAYTDTPAIVQDTKFTGTTAQAAALSALILIDLTNNRVLINGRTTPQQIYNYFKHFYSQLAQFDRTLPVALDDNGILDFTVLPTGNWDIIQNTGTTAEIIGNSTTEPGGITTRGTVTAPVQAGVSIRDSTGFTIPGMTEPNARVLILYFHADGSTSTSRITTSNADGLFNIRVAGDYNQRIFVLAKKRGFNARFVNIATPQTTNNITIALARHPLIEALDVSAYISTQAGSTSDLLAINLTTNGIGSYVEFRATPDLRVMPMLSVAVFDALMTTDNGLRLLSSFYKDHPDDLVYTFGSDYMTLNLTWLKFRRVAGLAGAALAYFGFRVRDIADENDYIPEYANLGRVNISDSRFQVNVNVDSTGSTSGGSSAITATDRSAIARAVWSQTPTGSDTDFGTLIAADAAVNTAHTATLNRIISLFSNLPNVNLTQVSIDTIVDAVWNELLTDHTTDNSAGAILNQTNDIETIVRRLSNGLTDDQNTVLNAIRSRIDALQTSVSAIPTHTLDQISTDVWSKELTTFGLRTAGNALASADTNALSNAASIGSLTTRVVNLNTTLTSLNTRVLALPSVRAIVDGVFNENISSITSVGGASLPLSIILTILTNGVEATRSGLINAFVGGSNIFSSNNPSVALRNPTAITLTDAQRTAIARTMLALPLTADEHGVSGSLASHIVAATAERTSILNAITPIPLDISDSDKTDIVNRIWTHALTEGTTGALLSQPSTYLSNAFRNIDSTSAQLRNQVNVPSVLTNNIASILSGVQAIPTTPTGLTSDQATTLAAIQTRVEAIPTTPTGLTDAQNTVLNDIQSRVGQLPQNNDLTTADRNLITSSVGTTTNNIVGGKIPIPITVSRFVDNGVVSTDYTGLTPFVDGISQGNRRVSSTQVSRGTREVFRTNAGFTTIVELRVPREFINRQLLLNFYSEWFGRNRRLQIEVFNSTNPNDVRSILDETQTSGWSSFLTQQYPQDENRLQLVDKIAPIAYDTIRITQTANNSIAYFRVDQFQLSYLDTLTAADVWNESLAGYTTAGTAGHQLGAIPTTSSGLTTAQATALSDIQTRVSDVQSRLGQLPTNNDLTPSDRALIVASSSAIPITPTVVSATLHVDTTPFTDRRELGADNARRVAMLSSGERVVVLRIPREYVGQNVAIIFNAYLGSADQNSNATYNLLVEGRNSLDTTATAHPIFSELSNIFGVSRITRNISASLPSPFDTIYLRLTTTLTNPITLYIDNFKINRTPTLSADTIRDTILDTPLADHTTDGTVGKKLDDIPITALPTPISNADKDDIVSRLLNIQLSTQTAVGTLGKKIADIPLSVSATLSNTQLSSIANQVWDTVFHSEFLQTSPTNSVARQINNITSAITAINNVINTINTRVEPIAEIGTRMLEVFIRLTHPRRVNPTTSKLEFYAQDDTTFARDPIRTASLTNEEGEPAGSGAPFGVAPDEDDST